MAQQADGKRVKERWIRRLTFCQTSGAQVIRSNATTMSAMPPKPHPPPVRILSHIYIYIYMDVLVGKVQGLLDTQIDIV